MPTETRAGFVAVLGRPNAGKSTLLNFLLGERLAMVSQKANATRKRMNIIITHINAQIVFIDTPGLHEKERELNKFMLNEALRAAGDSDIICFLAPVTDSLEHYENFLSLAAGKPHIIFLTKTDTTTPKEIARKLSAYSAYSDKFLAIAPISTKKISNREPILNLIAEHLPECPFYYDPEQISTSYVKEIYKELIREAIFENYSDEIPYGSDIIIEKIDEQPHIDRVFAQMIVEKESQKGIAIGAGGEALKRLGYEARRKLEDFSGKKIYLKIFVKVVKNWTNQKKNLEKLGYS